MPHGPKLSYPSDFEGRTALYRRLDVFKFEIRVLTVWPKHGTHQILVTASLFCEVSIQC
jgi:hypothetical protein